MRRTFWRSEVQNVSVLLEHVDLLNSGNGLHIQFLEGSLQLFVVLGARGLGFPHNLSSNRALAAYLILKKRSIATCQSCSLSCTLPCGVDRDATRRKRSPILFAAAAACSLASLVLSMFTEG